LFRSSAAINDRLVVVSVAIAVVILLDNDGVPIPMFVTVTDNGTVAVSITVPIVPGADCYANRSNSNSDFLCIRRHCCANAGNGGNYQSVFHHVLLTL
jgi:hypothetical protein